jgi:PTS system nitrogen regulatory IIA component
MSAITDVFSKDLIIFNPLNIENKKTCFQLIAAVIAERNPGLNQYELFNALYQRELIGSTQVATHIAIPHARVKNLTTPIGVITKLITPIPFSADETQTVSLLFSLFVAENAPQKYLDILAQLTTKLRDPKWTKNLLETNTAQALWDAFSG